MFCPSCGQELPDDSRFCFRCGAAVENTQQAGNSDSTASSASGSADTPEEVSARPKKTRKKAGQSEMDIKGKKVTENIYLCRDGLYRWVYEMPMMKNPTILFSVWKVMGLSGGIVLLFMLILHLVEGSLNTETLMFLVKLAAILAGIFLVISILGYTLLAAIYGWKYVVLFEMNDKEIRHIQVPKQNSKAQVIAMITAMAGLASKNLTTTGIGMMNAGRSSSTTIYKYVKSVRPIRRRSVIKLSMGLSRNHIYADGDDFDFALDYILKHCPENVQK